jgi:hypothetical protein
MDTLGDELPWENEPEAARGGGLTVSRILAWAVTHRVETGRWPTRLSGPLSGANCYLTWHAIDLALCLGLRGLPGGQSLGGLICDELLLLRTMLRDYTGVRGLTGGNEPEPGGHSSSKRPLSIATILTWADRHRAATGRWPSSKSGPVAGELDENWASIAGALIAGFRGLPGGTTLKLLLVEHRGPKTAKRYKDLTVEQILTWADAHRRATGRWPGASSGPIDGAWRLSWSSVARFLKYGGRGLPGGTTLQHLVKKHRSQSRPWPQVRPRLSIDQILAWADAHHAACGNWPKIADVPIAAAPGESWKRIDVALRAGSRGLPGGTSLPRLLAERRSVTRKNLSLETIMAWCQAHRADTGQWPQASSGAVAGAPGETWAKIDSALRVGCRGLPGGSSLCRFLRGAVFSNRKRDWRPLTIEQVLAWADAHYVATGQWPSTTSGVVKDVPGEKWRALYHALRKGLRGLPPCNGLAGLLAGRQPPKGGHPVGGKPAARG